MVDNVSCLILIVSPVAVAIISYVTIRAIRANKRSQAERLSPLAIRWNGVLIPGRFLSTPRLALRVDEIPGEVTFKSGGSDSPSWTKVQFNWPAPCRLRVVPESFVSGLRRAPGSDDIRLGWAAFDAAFWIEASDAPWTREFLSDRVQQGLFKFHQPASWRTTGAVTLDMGPAGLTLKFTKSLLDDRIRLEAFIELAVLIFQQARGTVPVAGIALAAVEVRGGSHCPVCGHEVSGGRNCARCRTPHHEECWKYADGCAVFACQRRRSAAAGS